MGCFPSSGVKSELEKVKAELEKVQKFQATLSKQNGDLKGTVQTQAQSIQNLQRYRERPQPRFKKRELFALSAVVPVLVLLILDTVSISVTHFDWVRCAQVTLLTAVVLLLFRLRANRGLEIPEVKEIRGGLFEPSEARPRRTSGDARVRDAAEGASERELEAITAVITSLRANPPPMLPESDALLQVQLLRFVREHGTHNLDNIERRYKAALHWRNNNLPEIPVAEDGGWLSSSEMPNGKFATEFVAIGINASFCKIGNPVKIERLGKFDLKRLGKVVASDPTARPRFNDFYLGLIEFLQQKLDQYSVEQGRLVQTYEIFDLEGLSPSIIFNTTVINFLNDVLINFSTHYPSSFRKACLINCPSWMPKLWGLVSVVLPKSVTAKVLILGKNYHSVLQEDLTPEALAWVESTHAQLIRAPHAGVLTSTTS
ncbi:hypothetical protein AB1Y20_021017 [Prymnesium parvum]|uniref:CRAL-TRIO domain-containing protein n=1 Tax=Prymnesium parvum TaxID=97485 RepID=A0AB34JK87_PRYPA